MGYSPLEPNLNLKLNLNTPTVLVRIQPPPLYGRVAQIWQRQGNKSKIIAQILSIALVENINRNRKRPLKCWFKSDPLSRKNCFS